MSIEIIDLTKEYKDIKALDNLNLVINDNELFSLLGLNGAGKTTLIKILSTLTRPTKGIVYINNYSILKDDLKIKEIIDISLQETSIARNLTVLENIKFYGKLNALEEDEFNERLEYLIDVFNLDKVKNKKAKKLSGGYQRKLSILLALLKKPKILFLDEPTLGLDVIARKELWSIIKKLKKEMTIILTTHYMEEAEMLSDRIGIINEGKLLFVGDKDSLYSLTNEQKVEDAFIKIVGDNYEK